MAYDDWKRKRAAERNPSHAFRGGLLHPTPPRADDCFRHSFFVALASAIRAAVVARDISLAYTIPPASVATNPPHASKPDGARPPKPQMDPMMVNTLTPLLSAMKLVAQT